MMKKLIFVLIVLFSTIQFSCSQTAKKRIFSRNLVVDYGLVIGNSGLTDAGTIKWTGTDFQGYDGSLWKSFTSLLTPTDNILHWNSTSNYYEPHASYVANSFYLSGAYPTSSTTLYCDYRFFPTNILCAGSGTLIDAVASSNAAIKGTTSSSSGWGVVAVSTASGIGGWPLWAYSSQDIGNGAKFTNENGYTLFLDKTGSVASGASWPMMWMRNNIDYNANTWNGTYLYIEDEPTDVVNDSKILEVDIDGVNKITFDPRASVTETAYTFDTDNTLTTGLRMAISNNGANPVNFEADGSVNIPTGATYKINGSPIGAPGGSDNDVQFNNSGAFGNANDILTGWSFKYTTTPFPNWTWGDGTNHNLTWYVGTMNAVNWASYGTGSESYTLNMGYGDAYMDCYNSSGYGGAFNINDAGGKTEMKVTTSAGENIAELNQYGLRITNPDYSGIDAQYAVTGDYGGCGPNSLINDGDATPDVSTGSVFRYNGTSSSVTITDLDNPVPGAVYRIIGNSSTYTVTINDGGNFKTSGTLVLGAEDVVSFWVWQDNYYIQLGPVQDN